MEYEEESEGDLRSLCDNRGLESTGTKEELIERLMDDDKEEAMEYAEEAKRYLDVQEETRKMIEDAVSKSRWDRVKDIITDIIGHISSHLLKMVLKYLGLPF